jgi:large subunit ribosomal protein L34
MHYPHKTSNIKRAKKIGFLVRMRTKKGRQMISRKRRVGRKVQVV